MLRIEYITGEIPETEIIYDMRLVPDPEQIEILFTNLWAVHEPKTDRAFVFQLVSTTRNLLGGSPRPYFHLVIASLEAFHWCMELTAV